jgi:hypothetical protein
MEVYNLEKFAEIKKIFMIEKVKKQNTWTDDEDNQLLELVNAYSSKNWKEISKNLINKSSIQCYSRYKQIRPGIKKGLWTNEEDDEVRNLVKIHGHQWSNIANVIRSRNGKQIRDRYLNYINPGTKHNEFTDEEDDTITKLYLKHGSRWSYIAQFCNGRTGDLIKNRFYSHIKKKVIISNQTNKRFKRIPLQKSQISNSVRIETKKITSKFKSQDLEELNIDSLKINEDFYKNEPVVCIVHHAIPTLPSNDNCVNVFDTKFFEFDDKDSIDESFKENNNSIFSDKSENYDRELSHSPSFFFGNLENNPFDYSSSSQGSSSDFDIKSQNYFI